MYYYSSNVPKVGQVVLGNLLNDKETEDCLYVRLPEYQNIEGMIPKSNLPKKRRMYNRVLAQMRKDVIIPCVLKSKPQINDDGTTWPLDLTLKRIDMESNRIFIGRFDNITRILKVMKFLAEETGVDVCKLCAGIWSSEIVELFAERIVYENQQDTINSKDKQNVDSADSDVDSDNSIDSDGSNSELSSSPQILTNLTDLYQRVIGNNNYLIEVIRRGMEIDSDLESKLRNVLTTYSISKKSDCSIQFKFRVDTADDPVQVLQNTFTRVMEIYPDIMIHYKGAPTYIIIKPNVGPADLQNVIDNLQETFETYLKEHEKCVYHLKFSLQNAEAKEPIYSFAFPRLVEI